MLVMKAVKSLSRQKLLSGLPLNLIRTLSVAVFVDQEWKIKKMCIFDV